VSRAFLEFGSKDDWVSKTLLKHTLAAIIQASNWMEPPLSLPGNCPAAVSASGPSHHPGMVEGPNVSSIASCAVVWPRGLPGTTCFGLRTGSLC
jgi:hypothetical protein